MQWQDDRQEEGKSWGTYTENRVQGEQGYSQQADHGGQAAGAAQQTAKGRRNRVGGGKYTESRDSKLTIESRLAWVAQ